MTTLRLTGTAPSTTTFFGHWRIPSGGTGAGGSADVWALTRQTRMDLGKLTETHRPRSVGLEAANVSGRGTSPPPGGHGIIITADNAKPVRRTQTGTQLLGCVAHRLKPPSCPPADARQGPAQYRQPIVRRRASSRSRIECISITSITIALQRAGHDRPEGSETPRAPLVDQPACPRVTRLRLATGPEKPSAFALRQVALSGTS